MSRRSQRARRQPATTFAAETWSGPATRGAFRRYVTSSTNKNEQQRSFHSRRKNREELLQRWLEETNQMKAQRRARFRSKEELEQVHYLEINAPPAYHLSLDGIPDETVVENWQPEELTVAGLREELKRRGLGLAGRRQQLVERLAQALDQERSQRKRQARNQRDEYHGHLDFTAFFHSMEGHFGPDHHEGQKTVTRPQLKSCIKKEACSLQDEQKEDEEEQEEQQEEDKEWGDKRIEEKASEDVEVDAELRTKKEEEDAKGGEEKVMEEQKEEHRNEETKERSEESSDKTKAEELADVKSEESCVTSAVAMPKRKLVARCPHMTARVGTSYRQKPIDLYLSPPDPLLPSSDSAFQTTTPPPLSSSPSSSASPEANRNQQEEFRSYPCHGNEAFPYAVIALDSGNDTAIAAALASASAINTATFASASPITISITAATSAPVETVTISSTSSTQQLSSDNHSTNINNKKRKRYTKRPCSHNQKNEKENKMDHRIRR